MDEYIFGANILENLTTGMYKDSKVIFREYIQNACDQIDKAVELGILSSIDKGEIKIWLDEDKRTISIKDNATGIPYKDFRKTLADIADSSKKIGEDKGFRGIGRLCGLAYCRELIFTSTAMDENVISVMRCDAKKMRELLSRNISGEKFTASEVLSQIYKFEYIQDETITSEHGFKVELIGVNEENTELLDFAEVKNYLSFVAPVQYVSTFQSMYGKQIHDHAKEIGYTIDEYTIKIGNSKYYTYEDVEKNYKTKFRTSKGEDDITGVEFKDFYDKDGNLIMWLWYGLSQFKGIIEKGCKMRGIRLRKENIQIGNEDALQKLFKEDRGQHYFIGELFAVSKSLIPNSQRDYFNENAMRVWFEEEIKRYFKEVLTKVYYNASSLNSSFKKIEDFQQKSQEHQDRIENGDYLDDEDIAKAESDLQVAKSKADEAQKKIDKLKQTTGNTEADSVLQKVANGIEKGRNSNDDINSPQISVPNSTPVEEQEDTITQKKTLWVDRLSKLSRKERKLVSEILSIVNESTDAQTVETIKNKIEGKYK